MTKVFAFYGNILEFLTVFVDDMLRIKYEISLLVTEIAIETTTEFWGWSLKIHFA